MVFRLSVNNTEDLEFLKKRLDKRTLSELQSIASKASDEPIVHRGQKLQSKDRSSNLDDKGNMIRRSKYGNIKTIDTESGLKFDSKWEAEVFRRLRNYEDQGKIKNLETQARVNLLVNNKKICAIVIDFKFFYSGQQIYLDAKSVATSPTGFKIKKKLFEALFELELYTIMRNQESILDKLT